MSYADKKRRALELRRDGLTYWDIAHEIGWKSHNSAHKAVKQALQETLQEPADELRILEAERLNKLYEFTIQRIDKDNLWAVDRALKIMERRAGLLGLDKPPERDWDSLGNSFLAGVEAGIQHQTEDLSAQGEASE
jgi:transposase-like protein